MNTTFYDAATLGNFELVREHLAKDAALVHARISGGFTALHGVAGEDQVEMATLLLDAGADPNAKTADGHTPLHLAAFQDMVELLVGRGAEIDARANDGNTPLLVQAAEAEGIEVMEALLEAGADANARDQHGETAMRIAADREEDDKVKLLRKFDSNS